VVVALRRLAILPLTTPPVPAPPASNQRRLQTPPVSGTFGAYLSLALARSPDRQCVHERQQHRPPKSGTWTTLATLAPHAPGLDPPEQGPGGSVAASRPVI
jgi:hypothetical protein